MRNLIKIALAMGAAAAPLSVASTETIVGLVGQNSIVTFDSAAPGVITSRGTLTGAEGDRLLGIDLRPATGQLYSVGESGRVYLIAPNSAGGFTATAQTTTQTASPAGAPPPLATGATPDGTSFGIDFNPVPDRLRLISDTNQNLRSDVRPGGATFVDTPVTRGGSNAIDIVASAYTNSFAGATSTTLYGLDAVTDGLVVASGPNAANAGTYILVGTGLGAGITFTNTDRVGFDISGATGAALFAINDTLFRVDLTTGVGTFAGLIGQQGITGITFASAGAAVPEPGTWATMLIGFGAIGYSLRRKTKPRAAFA